MLSGFYAAATGVLHQQRNLNVLGNNIANVNTPGFRVERVVTTTFEDALMTRLQSGGTARIGSATPMRLVQEVESLYGSGVLQETQRPMDLALSGPGFFNLRGEDGALYLTRGGNFDIDAQGFLTLSGTGPLLGVSGNPIQVRSSNFTVEEDGRVYDDRGRLIDTVLVTDPTGEAGDNPGAGNNPGTGLRRSQNGMYTLEDEGQNQPITDQFRLYQGALERSNIDLNREYTMVMEASRAFQACSNALKIVDQMGQKAATQIASI